MPHEHRESLHGHKACMSFKIEGDSVGDGYPCFVIAEIAQAHDGSLGVAHAYIDAVARTGANAIKFQTHIADAESTKEERFRVSCFPQDRTRYDYWKRMEFSKSQWEGLAVHAREKGLVFLSTPFSPEAVELLDRIGMPAWKIGSGETTNLPMLELVARSGKPVLLSTGMSSWSEIDAAVQTIRSVDGQFSVFQCTTSYPCQPEKIGLNVISDLRARYSCPVGLSDHSGSIYAPLAAVVLGANLIEVHTVFSKECFGPDVSASVTTSDLARLVEGIRFIESSLQSVVDKDQLADQMVDLKRMFGKSVYLRRDVASGSRISFEDLTLKKPGTGIPASKLHQVLGRLVRHDLKANEQLKEEDLR